MNNEQYSSSPPGSAGFHNEVDSAATTLLASATSSKNDSLDFSSRKTYADVELARWDELRSRRKGSVSSGSQDGDSSYSGNAENEQLLMHDTASSTLLDRALATNAVNQGPPTIAQPKLSDKAERPVTWSSLPRKGQLAILTLARLSEPLTQTSLQAYMFYQLKSFKTASGDVPSDSTVASQAGMLAAAFTGAQFCTAIMWGRLADWEGLGRKRVILIGLLGTAIGSLGFGFSESFKVAVFWRAVGGMLNGNMGVMRTMISEIVKEKKYQSRAFLLLPMTFNIGVIIGPLLGGILADPIGNHPGLFGPNSTLGGENGVWLFTRWPYALPNIVNAVFLISSALALILGMEETLEGLRGHNDYGLRLGKWIGRTIFRKRSSQDYTSLAEHENTTDIELTDSKPSRPKSRRKLPFRRIWTKNVLFTLLSHGLLAMHVGTCSNLWFVFLSTPRFDPDDASQNETLHLPDNYQPSGPFKFTGGLALPPSAIGTALAILGVMGISLQLLLYPRLAFVLGTIRSYRLSLLLFPLSYSIVPWLAIIPSSVRPPGPSSGILVWLAITMVLSIQVLGRTFALPSTTILVNNASPHPSVLGSVHGIAQSVSSATRTVGPVLAGWVYGVGLEKGIVGTAWWGMAGIAVVGAVAGQWVKEGDGHEIWLEGEKEEEQEQEEENRRSR